MTDESLFLRAVAIPDPAERAAFLDRECAGNPDLRREVEELLAAHAAGGPLDRPTIGDAVTADHRPAKGVGAVLGGKYKLVEEIGEGNGHRVDGPPDGAGEAAGRGEADQGRDGLEGGADPVRGGAAGARAHGPPEHRQGARRRGHAGRAPVLRHGAGQGVPITTFCDQRKLTPHERLELFVPVCQAVQHAHQKGVIHRDVKPSNVLVAPYDDRPVPKVIDFGVAKATGPALTEKTLHTGLAGVVGTPEYMSPEQAGLNNPDIDTRSDVHSLGVLLYELLASLSHLAPPPREVKR